MGHIAPIVLAQAFQQTAHFSQQIVGPVPAELTTDTIDEIDIDHHARELAAVGSPRVARGLQASMQGGTTQQPRDRLSTPLLAGATLKLDRSGPGS
jgi:hypothetical protein